MDSKSTFSTVYAYLRFSSDAQADGNSFDRQREATLVRIQNMGLEGVPLVWIEDPGLSAYKGSHLRSGELGRFLKQVTSGHVTNGLFICESVSRASRQGALVLLTMLNALLDAGFSVLFLDQQKPFNKAHIPRFLVVELSLLAELAQEESRIKSEYAKLNWSKKRDKARSNPGMAFTGECPNWLTVIDNRYTPIPERVSSILEIFKLALNGWGISKLVRYANTNKLAAPGKNGTWHLSLIKRVLTNRALIGEFQPHIDEGRKRVPHGDPIPEFYPPAIDKDLFYAVQGLRSKVAKFPKRRDGNNFNYLQGLAKCACGGAWRRMNKNSGTQEGYALYGCSNRIRATTKCLNVNARAFDLQFIGHVCDNIPELLASGENPTADKSKSLEAQLQELTNKKKSILKFIENNMDLHHELSPRLRDIISEEETISKELEKLVLDAAPPPGFTFGEAVDVFIPAYLDVFAEQTADWENAYKARSLFRTRIIESVSDVRVSADRTSIQITLKNGLKTEFEIDPTIKFKAINDELDHDDLTELASKRSLGIANIKNMNNSPTINKKNS